MTAHEVSRRQFTLSALGAASVALLPAAVATKAHAEQVGPGATPTRGLRGDSIQIDPGFAYYQGRSPASIADELVANGYRIAHYFVVNENIVDGDLIDALHDRGITVWALVLGNGSYSVERFPPEWPEWQMELIKPVSDGFYRFSLHSSEYTTWKKQALARLVTEYPFDGIEIAECYFPEWNSISRGYYGDVGPLAQAAFREQYDLDIPNFTDPADPTYYQNDTYRYSKWVQFRVDAVNGFLDEVINGSDGVRRARNDILVATWSLGINAGPDSVARLREFQGLDASAMIATVRPDAHFIQTHWPDWIRPDLPADYVASYRPFVDDIRDTHPDIPLGIQTDIGSQPAMARDTAWLATFKSAAKDLGLATWTAYEYHLGAYIYEEAPVPTSASRGDDGSLRVSFQKRISTESARLDQSFTVYRGSHLSRWIDPSSIRVDGNLVHIAADDLPSGNFELHIANVTDDPTTWLYHKDSEANVVPPGTRIAIMAAD